MKVHYSVAAGWLALLAPAAVVPQVPDVPSIHRSIEIAAAETPSSQAIDGAAYLPRDGQRVALDMAGDGLISVQVEHAAFESAAASPSANGRFPLPSRSADRLLDKALNTEAAVRARSLVERDGRLYLAPSP